MLRNVAFEIASASATPIRLWRIRVIAAVSMGLSIDSSIHYIFAYLRAKRLGATEGEAIQSAHGTVGLSMIFATLALIVGFSVLASSKFTPTVYFGSLVSLAMLGGLLGNLVILPILLPLGAKKEREVVNEKQTAVSS